MADLITTCYGGRNRQCAEEFAKQRLHTVQSKSSSFLSSFRQSTTSTSSSISKSSSISNKDCITLWETIEREVLKGQKLQGTLTAKEAYMVLQTHNLLHSFPLISTIYEIAFLGKPIQEIINGIYIPTSQPTKSNL
jgi:glycerol-3-phosphate dehydrogenase (NAD+)